MARFVQQWATSRSGGPYEVSTQSTTPLTAPSAQRTLPRWKSRCRKLPSKGGGSRSIAAIARSHSGESGCLPAAHDW